MSLRIRVLAGLVAIAIVLGVGAVMLATTTRANMTAQVDSQLRSAAELVQGFDFDHRAAPGTPDGSGVRQLSTLYLGYVTADGSVETLYAPDFTSADSAVPAVDSNQARSAAQDEHVITVGSTTAGVRFRLLAVPNGRGEVAVLALPLTSVDAAMTRLVTVEIIVSTISGMVLLLVGWWVIHLGVRPVKTMTSVATRIAAGELSSRVPESNAGTEAAELGTALNAMLGRIELAFDERSRSETRLRQFVADASHELRTPVCTIRGYAELFRMGALNEPDDLADAMRRTEQEAIRMGALVDDLLLLAKLDLGRTLATDPVDVTSLARDAARDAHAAAPSRAIVVRDSGQTVVSGDEHRLRQVLANIVQNALVHTPSGSPIDIEVRGAAGAVEVAVIDHGAGIDAADAARVFDRFVRGDSSRSRDRGGSGLGLAIVQAVVSAHRGRVRVGATPGGGATDRRLTPGV